VGKKVAKSDKTQPGLRFTFRLYRCIVTLFIFDDMTENIQIAVSSILQSTVKKPPIFIIKTDRIRVIYKMGTKLYIY
jgi:hypothetical protein